ncbi:transforming growth factor beta activator LRRC33 isoform X2 [Hemicordylus capensis]|uniref:transforming growth factor beta activator LRRC33 isoform X2 n=1 Tax=Hemicordylus capensis TaxID=884348 RepID=UPI002302352F|nr:transforming growth factor beta activator LRRC33 isoform X2 [Hemicordylus capensis]
MNVVSLCRSPAAEMAIIALSISLGIIVLGTGWGSKVTAYHSLCKLEKRTADCSRKRLGSVPADLPAATEELFLDANIIQILKNASLVSYQVLQSLSLRENGLELIEPGAFLSSRSLTSLSVANNGLSVNYSVTATAIWTLTALRKLDLSGNQLTEDMVVTMIQHLSSLESLSLARNAIMRLDHSHFQNLLQLQDLDLQQNYIFEIESGTFDGLRVLQQLNLAYNYMPCIVEFDLTQLRVLNVSNNLIEWFLAVEDDIAFELETLDLSHNWLLFFPLLPKQNKLQTLLLMHNQMSFYGDLFNHSESKVQLLFLDGNITNITTFNLWEENNHGNLSSLSFLDMSWNQVRYLPDRFFEGKAFLTHLNISHNCLESLHVQRWEWLNTLTDLDLSYNQLSDLQVNLSSGGTLPNLQWFNLSTNRLHGLPAKLFTHTTKITTVDLSNNPIKICGSHVDVNGAASPDCIDVHNAGSLKNLFLASCDLAMLGNHVFWGTSLAHLDLSNNPNVQLGSLVPLQDVAQSLQVLSLRNTSLSAAKTTMDFSIFQKLVNLDLSENALVSFPESLIGLRLHTLDLRKNGLHTLPQHAMQKQLGRSLHVIYLSQNPYDCCRLGWWDALHSLGTIHIADWKQVTCNYSSKFISAANLPESVLQDCKWLTADMMWVYLVLFLPTCFALLVAFVIVFLTFRQRILQMVKSRGGGDCPESVLGCSNGLDEGE